MLGACYLTEWAPELPKLYEIGREIEVYRDAAELVGKLEELTADEPRRRILRQSGQRRALTDHNVARSVQRVAQCLGLKVPA